LTAAPTDVIESLSVLGDDQHVLTIGNFDGVHRGHRHLLNQVMTLASEHQVRSLVVTFEPHPIAVLRPEHAPPRIATPEAKVAALRRCGIDDVVVLPFTRALAGLEPDDFLTLLMDAAHPTAIVVGEGFRFGKQRQGDIETLKRAGPECGFDVHAVQPLVDESGVVSSSRIRTALMDGELEEAERLLGRRYRLSGQVEHGEARGRDLGYPTANLHLPTAMCVPHDGIYAAYAQLDDPVTPPRQSLVYIGTSPTFGERERRVEVNILDYRGDLYSRELEIEFVERVRADRTFESAEALMKQMSDDEIKSRAMLAKTEPERARKGD
jgi:riboflavin kinase / FMN adenylyltransferase